MCFLLKAGEKHKNDDMLDILGRCGNVLLFLLCFVFVKCYIVDQRSQQACLLDKQLKNLLFVVSCPGHCLLILADNFFSLF